MKPKRCHFDKHQIPHVSNVYRKIWPISCRRVKMSYGKRWSVLPKKLWHIIRTREIGVVILILEIFFDCIELHSVTGTSNESIIMEHTKTARNAKPTIKFSELNLTPIYIALLVVLISIGELFMNACIYSLRTSINFKLIFHLIWFFTFSVVFLMEKEISKTHRHPSDRSLWIR